MSDAVPYDLGAERAVLGSVLTGAPVVDDLADELQGRDFYQPRHELIWAACLAVHRDGDRVDPPLVARKLAGDLGRAGGAPYLAELIGVEVAPNPRNARHYAKAVLDAALSRRLLEAAQRIAQHARSGEDAAQVAEDARKLVDEAASHATTELAGMGAGELLAETLDGLESDVEPGLQTGWPDLDDVTGGLHPGQLIVVGARPGVGKSVIARNLAAHAASNGVGVHLASLEMTRDEVMGAMVSAASTVELGRIKRHQLTEDDWHRISRRTGSITQWPLWVDDSPAQSLLQLRSRARTTKRRMGDRLGLLVVDYLQLMAPRDRRVPREQQVGELSEGLKGLAKELHVPVVALAQVNRGSADRADRRPVITDLRESGRIEADADQVWLLHREDLVDPDTERLGELDVIVAKNRSGPMSTVALSFQGHYSRAVSMAT